MGREQLTHEAIERDVAAWLAAGNEITRVAMGESGKMKCMSELELNDLLNKRRAAKGQTPAKIYRQPRGYRKKLPKEAYNLIGKKFYHLEVIEKTHYKTGGVGWICKCDCGDHSSPIQTHKLIAGIQRFCSKKCPFFNNGMQKKSKKVKNEA